MKQLLIIISLPLLFNITVFAANAPKRPTPEEKAAFPLLPNHPPAIRGALPDGPKFLPGRPAPKVNPQTGVQESALDVESLLTPPDDTFQLQRRNNFYKKEGYSGLHRWATSGHWTNYDEANVVGWRKSVPDLLTTLDGKKVTDAETWLKVRRPEVIKIVESYMFGKVPATAPKVVWTAGEPTTGMSGDTPTISLTATGKFVNADGTPFTAPASGGGGMFGGRGGAGGGLTVSYTIPANAPGRVPLVRGGNLAQCLAMGFGTVNFGGSAPNVRSNPPSGDDWGAIRKTAWVVSKGLDYLETDPRINPQIAVTGHSIGGKQALMAAVFDERVAVCFASCSGLGGAQMARHDWGETIDDVAQLSPDNYCENMQYWVSHYDEMPLDSHFLVALVAPRALLISGGTEDQWSDPVGVFWAGYYASAVYKLLGEKVFDNTEPPAPDTFIGEKLVFHDHVGGHMPSASENAKYQEMQQKYMKVIPFKTGKPQ
jgi:hypothetical protein